MLFFNVSVFTLNLAWTEPFRVKDLLPWMLGVMNPGVGYFGTKTGSGMVPPGHCSLVTV